MDALTAHFGGLEHISAPMSILLDSAIRPKLIVLRLISEWVNRQAELISATGELPNVLGANYLAYTNGLRRDLESLANMAKDAGMKTKPPKICTGNLLGESENGFHMPAGLYLSPAFLSLNRNALKALIALLSKSQRGNGHFGFLYIT